MTGPGRIGVARSLVLYVRGLRLWQRLAAVLTLLAALVSAGVALFGSPFVGAAAHPTGTPSPSVSSTAARTPATSGGAAAGDCLSAGRVVVSCAAPHRWQVLGGSAADCSARALVRYLGGLVPPDVIVTTVTRVGGDGCVFADPSGGDGTGSAAGVLAGPAGDRWRRCRDDRSTRTDLGCADAHTGEYVGLPAGAVPDLALCTRAAEDYMELAFDRVAGRLKVVPVAPPGAGPSDVSCRIDVLGHDVLTASLRRIGVNALPLRHA
jgi:hypothetical protein